MLQWMGRNLWCPGGAVPRILIADDNANIQKMVSLAFQESGIDVVSVGNGEAAVRRLSELNPDLVLADIFMPVRNGYEVCEYVKKDQRFSQVPVILLVGAFDPLDEKEARRVGADGILKKPFVPPDPLIAMVTSVLEKNPKIAAEIAKAKAAREVIPEPVAPPVPEPEVLAKREVKPLPEFPEPSPEEAALVYGFGSGRRTLGDDAELPASEAAAPAAAAKEAADEDEAHTGTSRDWRRAAADFEVPEDIAKEPAFPSDESFSAEFAAMPAAKPLRSNEFRPEIEEPQIEMTAKDSALEVGGHVPTPEIFEEPLENEMQASEPPLEEPSARSAVAPEKLTAAPVRQEVETPLAAQREVAQEAPSAQILSQPESGTGSNFRHWMDALAGGPSSILGGWVDALKKKQEPAKEEALEQPSSAHEAAPPASVAEELASPLVSADVVESAGPALESSPGPQAPFAVSAGEAASFDEEPSSEDETQVEAWPAEPLHFDAPSAPHVEAYANRAPGLIDESAAVRVTPEPLLDAQDSGDGAQVLRDPGLIEPQAVHVRPEPLLEADEPPAQPAAPVRPEELAPVYSFFRNDAATLNDIAKRDDALASAAPEEAPVAFESSVQEFHERIPTGPPPNREALAGIPFLTPPPDFHAERRQEMDPETVDAIVQRVVEKLGPQLQELLSQNMKPLVENLIQSELAKKD
jgi:CheY-like chemotaxis protein